VSHARHARPPSVTWPLLTLLTAQAAGQTGSWASLAAALPVALASRGAGHLVVITAAWGGPAALSRLAGAPIDRLGPRVTGTACWAAAAIPAAALAFMHRQTLPAVLVALGLLSLFRGSAMAAGHAAPTWLPQRPDTARAGVWLVVAAAVPVLIGPLGATSLLAAAGARAAWAMVAGLLAAGAVASVLVPAVRPPPAIAVSPAPGGGTGLVPILAITAGLWLTYGTLSGLAPLDVQTLLHAPLTVYGEVLACYAVGGLLAVLALGQRGSLLASRWGVGGFALGAVAGEWVFATAGRTPAALAGALLWGAGGGMFTVCSRAALLRAVPAARHGRATGWWIATQSFSNVAPTAVLAVAVAAAGLRAVLVGACAVGLACVLAYLARTALSPRPASAPIEVLGEPARRQILDVLRTGEQPVQVLVRQLGLSQPAVSKHLRVLRDAGLVAERPDGQRPLYRLQAEPLIELDEWLEPYRGLWRINLDKLEAHLAAQQAPFPGNRRLTTPPSRVPVPARSRSRPGIT
jgi:DNA-binding transcriptional ArsR family regulator